MDLPILTEYRILQIEKDYCERKAVEFANKAENALAKFYKNASEGFFIKSRKMTKQQAMQEGRI